MEETPLPDRSSAERTRQMAKVLEQVSARRLAGEPVSDEQVTALHPELMPELREQLKCLQIIQRAGELAKREEHQATGPVPPAAGSPAESSEILPLSLGPETEDLLFDTPPADSLPGYEIIREIHRGGQGVVYEAVQRSTKRKVAVKVMREGPFASKRDKARFEREVEVLGQLKHPNIVAIHDSGTAGGSFYFAMDYIAGQPLDAWMAGRQLSVEETLRLFRRICEAVNAAHLRGVIHRDLKPGNIRIDPEGEPHILDFGLAKVAMGPDEASLMTVTGQFVGSLPWASPEQAEGVPAKIDVRTDVYSLGVILYHALTGRFPYDATGIMRDVLDRIINSEPAKPSTVRPQINDEVQTIVLKCLNKSRERRYQTAGELARDIGHYLAGEPIEAKRDSTIYLLKKQLRRYRVPVAVAAGFVLVLGAALVVSVSLWERAARERDRAQAAELKAEQERDAARNQQRLAEQRLFDGLLTAGDSNVKSKQYAEARKAYLEAWTLADQIGLSNLQPRLGWLNSYVLSPPPLSVYRPGKDEGLLRRVLCVTRNGPLICIEHGRLYWEGKKGSPGFEDPAAALARIAAAIPTYIVNPVTGLCFGKLVGYTDMQSLDVSADGRQFCTSGWHGTVRLWDSLTQQELRRIPAESSVKDCIFSPDQKTLICSHIDGNLVQWDLLRDKKLWTIETGIPDLVFACSPDGRWLVAGGANSTCVLIDRETATISRHLEGHGDRVYGLAFSGDSQRLLTGSWDKTVRLWDVVTGRQILRLSGHTGIINGVAISGDGRLGLSGGADGLVKLWDLNEGRELQTWSGHTGPVHRVAFLPDGQTAVSMSSRECVVWKLPQSEAAQAFAEDGRAVDAVSASPDTRTVLCGNGSMVRHWDLASGTELGVLIGHTATVRAVAFLPDGQKALSAGEDSTLRLWDIATSREIQVLTGHTDAISAIAVSRGGSSAISAGVDGSIRLWDLQTGVGREVFRDPTECILGIALSPDGRLALTAHRGRTVRLWDLETARMIQLFFGHGDRVTTAVILPDGLFGLSGSWDNSLILWDLTPGSPQAPEPFGRAVRTFTGHVGWVRDIAASPDGRTAFSGSLDTTVRVWSIETGKELRCLTGHSAGVRSLDLSKDDRVLLSASDDGHVIAWDFALPNRYRELEAKATAAYKMLGETPGDPRSLLDLGEWYAFREADHLAAELLEKARNAGAAVSPLTLARCYWRLGRLADAGREFQLALQAEEAPAEYLQLCLRAVSHPPSPQGTPDWTRLNKMNVEAWKLRRDGRLAEAESLQRKIVEDVGRLLPPGHSLRVKYEAGYAILLLDLKRDDDALNQLAEVETALRDCNDEQSHQMLRQAFACFYLCMVFKRQPGHDRNGLQQAIARGGTHPDHLNWQGIALLGVGQFEESKALFQRVLPDHRSWSDGPPGDAGLTRWTSAFWLGLVDEQTYTRRWAGTPERPDGRACEPWFYVGLRHQLSGNLEKARAAYRQSVQLGKVPNADPIWNRAEEQLKGIDAATSAPATQVSSRPS